jgi:hypothetical protein
MQTGKVFTEKKFAVLFNYIEYKVLTQWINRDKIWTNVFIGA